MKMSNKIYDVLKWIALIALPASATLYSLLAGTWGLPYGEQIVQTINGVATFIGALIAVSSAQYKKNNTTE